MLKKYAGRWKVRLNKRGGSAARPRSPGADDLRLALHHAEQIRQRHGGLSAGVILARMLMLIPMRIPLSVQVPVPLLVLARVLILMQITKT